MSSTSFLLPDYPETAKWLSADEKALAADRLRLEGSHGDSPSLTWPEARATLVDWRLYAHYAVSRPQKNKIEMVVDGCLNRFILGYLCPSRHSLFSRPQSRLG